MTAQNAQLSTNNLFETLNPPQRLLMGPGPINAYPRVHQAIPQPRQDLCN